MVLRARAHWRTLLLWEVEVFMQPQKEKARHRFTVLDTLTLLCSRTLQIRMPKDCTWSNQFQQVTWDFCCNSVSTWFSSGPWFSREALAGHYNQQYDIWMYLGASENRDTQFMATWMRITRFETMTFGGTQFLSKWDGNSMGWMLGSRKRGAVTWSGF